MAIQFLDHKVEVFRGLTGTNTWEFEPWNFEAAPTPTAIAKYIIEWDIVVLMRNETAGTSYGEHYMKKWLWKYVPGSGGVSIQIVNISTASGQVIWNEVTAVPRIAVTGNATIQTLDICGSARILACIER